MQPEISDQILYSFLTGGYCASSTSTNIMPSSTSTNIMPSSFYPFAIEEAERRRRERINSHLNKLRNLLSCNSKTDKAKLLEKVVQRVKELKQQTLEIPDETLPSETDEISVLNLDCSEDDGRVIIKVSFSCDDRPELFRDLMETLKSLQIETLSAAMTTVGGRTRNVLAIAADRKQHGIDSVHFLQKTLKSLLERSSKSVMMGQGGGGERLKRLYDIITV